MLYIASTLLFHADRFDVLPELLQHYFEPHGSACAHQDQLLEVEELVYVIYYI